MQKNKRAEKMWDIIRKYDGVGFVGADVVDLGCGYGDLIQHSIWAGAQFVMGVDSDPNAINVSSKKAEGILGKQGIVMFELIPIEEFIKTSQSYYDIGFCTSVLPYVENPSAVLGWMKEYVGISIIECQYAGDGPGFEGVRDDRDMGLWLEGFWEFAHKIGETDTEIRAASRSIWICFNV